MAAVKSNFYIQTIKKPVAGNWFFIAKIMLTYLKE